MTPSPQPQDPEEQRIASEPAGLRQSANQPGCRRFLLRKPRRRGRGLRRICVAIVATGVSLACLAVVAFGGLFLWLKQGRVAFDVRPQIIAALNERVGHGYRFDLASTALAATDHGPTLVIEHLAVTDASARPVVSAPRASISVDPLSLLFGKVAARTLEVQDVDLHLVILPSGKVAVSAGRDGAPFTLATAFSGGTPAGAPVAPREGPVGAAAVAPEPPRPARNAALEALTAAMRTLVDATAAPNSALDALDRVSVTGRLVLDDQLQGATTVFSDAVLSFDKSPDGTAALAVSANGPAGRWSLMARASAGHDGSKTLTVSAKDLSLDEITLAGGLRSLGFDFDLPVSADLTITLGADREIASAIGTFSLGKGYFHLDDPNHEPLLIDSAMGGFHLDVAANALAIDRTELRAEGSDFVMTGHVDPPRIPDGPWTAQAEASGVFGAERPGEKPIPIHRATASLHFLPLERRLILDRADVTGPEIDFTDTADIRFDGTGIHLKNAASVKHMPAATLLRLWPSLVAPPVRAWLLVNLRGGTVESGSSVVNLNDTDLKLMRDERSIPDDHAKVVFAVSGVSLGFMPGVPPLMDLDGSGVGTGRTFHMDIRHGSMEVSPGHRLTLADGTFHVPDGDPKPTPAFVDAHVTGGVDSVVELLSREALKPYADLSVEPASVRGQIDGRLTVAMKLGPNVPAEETKVGVSAALTNFGMDKIIGKEGLADAAVKLDVDKAGLRAKGEGRIYGAPAVLDVRKPPNGAGEAVIAMTLDEAARARIGIEPGWGLKGLVSARVSAPLSRGEKARSAAVELDLARASMEGPVPGFSKAAGRAARATFTITAHDGGATLDNLLFEGGGALVRGTAELAKEGGVASSRLSQVRLSPGDDLRVETQQAGDVLKVTVHGSNLDSRPFLKWLSAPAQDGEDGRVGGVRKGALDLDLRSTILTGYNGQAITGAEFQLARRGGQIRRLQLTGRLGRQPLSLSTSQTDGTPRFVVRAGDAGASLLFMDLYKRMAGGRLDATLTMSGSRLDGVIGVHEFTIREDPAIRRLAVEGLASQRRDTGASPEAEAQPIDASAMQFVKLEASFTKIGSSVAVHDGSMYGPSLGATVSGTLDLTRDQVNLAGTFVPLYGVNNLFSQVPLFGPLLGGGRHEGLVGLSYKITGSATNPTLNVNPLSVLAPGFLRQVFGAFESAAEGNLGARDHADGPAAPAAGSEGQ